MNKILFFGLLCSFLAIQVYGQQSPGGTKANAAKPPVVKTDNVASSQPKGLSVDNIVSMSEAGLSDDVIVARLRKEDKPFDLSTDDLIRLKKAKISDVVMKVMMDPKAEIQPVTSQPVSTMGSQTPIVPGITTTPSGATPINGTPSNVDPNDPMVAHDSGIYLLTKNRDGKSEMIVLERAAYQGSKTGGLFASAMTYGIKKVKSKAVLPGARASIRTADGSPEFYFYFDDKATGLGKSYFGISNLSNPNQFALLKLEVSKNRETVIAEGNAFGSSSGTSEKAMVGFKSERVRPGLYKVTMNEPLKAGEYCFLASSGVSVAGAAAATDIFDFGVNLDK